MKTLNLLLAITVLGFFIGCSDKSTEPVTGSGTLKMYLVDAPAGYDAVNIGETDYQLSHQQRREFGSQLII